MFGKKKKEEPVYEELKGILGNADDYHVYHMKKSDNLLAYLIGAVLGGVVAYAFFRTLPVTVIAAVVCAVKAPPYMNQFRKKKRLEQLRNQFRDLLESLASSYSAGKNTMGAFQDACDDMISIYGEDADLVHELEIICTGLGNNVNIEKLLQDFAARCEVEDIQSFADVFEVCNRQGGDLKKIVNDTRDIINDKMEIEMEIGTMLAGTKNEFHIMMVMPVVVILSLSSLGTMSAASNTIDHIVVKLVCIGIFALAYVIGQRIIDIKI